MARCPLCDSRKGKRPCRLAQSALVCSLCCGRSREAAACAGCSWYQPPVRAYEPLPRFSTQKMEDSEHLQRISFPVEAGVCSLDRAREFELSDAQAIAIFELLLDLYAFGDPREAVAPRIAALDCGSVVDLAERELRPYDRDTIARVIATVRFVARRRAAGGRDHVEVLQRYCGAFLGPGVGLRILEDGTEIAVGELRSGR